jgi:hypothetical protein
MMVSGTGYHGARVLPRHEHQRVAHDHAREHVKTDAKVVKEHETKRKHAEEVSVREVGHLIF